MPPTATRAPFAERGGSVRGLLDLVTGCYPPFLFGAGVGHILPVFHLHESTPAALEPRLQYLADNGYQTVTADAIARLVRDGVHPGPRTVALCFDDAWASLWTTAAPLLRRFGMQAITFAIPARLTDAPALRPTLDDRAAVGDEDRSAVPFVTWQELEVLHGSGLVDVQSHSWSHSMVFTGRAPESFVTPAFVDEPLLNRPRKADAPGVPGTAPEHPAFLTPSDLGAPLYARRSRLSDGWRYHEDPAARDRCLAHVAARGGPAFFARERWPKELRAVHGEGRGRFESDEERERAVAEELDRARAELDARLGSGTVRHCCAPWGIGGTLARRAARRVGYETLFADHLFGRRAVRAGDDPYALMRLHERFIHCLPGRGRRYFHSAR
jgi:peptidoglycan/xylan/chitin deacetylase (PgdA/CDA1 family)